MNKTEFVFLNTLNRIALGVGEDKRKRIIAIKKNLNGRLKKERDDNYKRREALK